MSRVYTYRTKGGGGVEKGKGLRVKTGRGGRSGERGTRSGEGGPGRMGKRRRKCIGGLSGKGKNFD